MAVRQITLLRFKDDTTADDIRALGESFARLVDVVPGLLRFEFGPDLGLEETTLDYALVIDFEGAEDWRAYREHPEHLAHAEKFLPVVEQVERVHYSVPD